MQKAFKKLAPKRQEEILDAVAGVFAEKGYHQASIPAICEAAGVSNGALYKYFRNKEEIYLSVLHHGIDLMINDLFRKYTADSESIFQALEALFKGLTKFTQRYRPYVEMWVGLSSCSMNRFSADVATKIEQEGHKLFHRLIEEAKRRGEIDENLSTDLTTYSLDCHMTLFTYSLVSEYHRRRFSAFFKEGRRGPSQQEKVALIVESAKQLFGTG
jgi:AcrR family transcriptional regulator